MQSSGMNDCLLGVPALQVETSEHRAARYVFGNGVLQSGRSVHRQDICLQQAKLAEAVFEEHLPPERRHFNLQQQLFAHTANQQQQLQQLPQGLSQNFQRTPLLHQAPQEQEGERELERWAVEVGSDTSRLLDYVLNEPEVIGGNVSLYLIFVMCDIPCAMGIAYPVSEMEERVAAIHENHIRKTVLSPLVREIRRKRKRVQVHGHVEREDKVDTGLCEAAKRLNISRLVITSRRGGALRRKANDVFAENCANQLAEQGCSVMMLQQGSKKRTPGGSSLVVVPPSGLPGRALGGATPAASPAAPGPSRLQSSGSWRSLSFASPAHSTSSSVLKPRSPSPPRVGAGDQAPRQRQLFQQLQNLQQLLLAPRQGSDLDLQQQQQHQHLQTPQQLRPGAVDSSRQGPSGNGGFQFIRTDSFCSAVSDSTWVSGGPVESASVKAKKARAMRSSSDSLLLEDRADESSAREAQDEGGVSRGLPRTAQIGVLGSGSLGCAFLGSPADETATRAPPESDASSLVPSISHRKDQLLLHQSSLNRGTSLKAWESPGRSGSSVPLESLVRELQQLQTRLTAAHQDEEALKRSVEDAQDELKQANTQKEEESVRRVACEAELAIAKFQAQEASRTVAMLQTEVEMARRAAAEALAEAELARREVERAQGGLQGSDLQPLDFRIYSYQELAESTDGWSQQRLILDGDTGLVYRGTVGGHMPVAIRVLKDPSAPGALQEFQKEVKLGSGLRHPNLVLLMGCCMDPPCLVYEYMPQCSLYDRLICRGGTPPLHWTTRFHIFWDVCTAFIHLHCRENPIVHFDLKPSNILLDRNFVAKVGDVGLARIMRSLTDDTISRPLGTLGYTCPELLRSNVFCGRTDVYSLGMVLFDLLGGVRNSGRTKGLVQAMEEAVAELDLKRMSQLTDPSAKWPAELAMDLACLARECTAARRKDRPEVARGVMPWLERLRPMVEQLAQKEAEAARRPLRGCVSLLSVASVGSSVDDDEASSGPSMPQSFRCPIKLELMERPVIAADGHTYEEEAIRKWLGENDTSPVTNVPLPHKELIPNHNLKSLISDWKEQRLLHRPLRQNVDSRESPAC